MLRVVVVVVASSLCACGGHERQDRTDFDKAAALFADAERALDEGRVQDVGPAYQQALSVTSQIRMRATRARMGEHELADGPQINGATVRAWEEEWKKTLQQDVERNFDALFQKSRAGQVQWVVVRDFISQYGTRALERKWMVAADAVSDNVKNVEGVKDGIVFRCVSMFDPAYCKALRAVLEPKLARKILDDTNLASSASSAAFGVVQVTAEYGRLVEYRQTGGTAEPSKSSAAMLPGSLVVRVETYTNRDATNWDGEKQLVVESPPPDVMGAFDTSAVGREQDRKLEEKMQVALASLPAQTVQAASTTTPTR